MCDNAYQKCRVALAYNLCYRCIFELKCSAFILNATILENFKVLPFYFFLDKAYTSLIIKFVSKDCPLYISYNFYTSILVL